MPVRRSGRQRVFVEPYQGGERLRPRQADEAAIRRVREQNAARYQQVQARDGVPLTAEGIRNRMIRDDQYSEGPASKKFIKELPTIIKIISRGDNNALSQNYTSNFRQTHAKFRLGDWNEQNEANSFARFSSNK